MAPLVSNLPAQVGPYSGDQVVNAAIIIKAGQAMGLDAKAVTVGVMTAMGESQLVNIDRGDTVGPDARGLFQQRANGAWGSYEERMNPAIAATRFFKALTAVPEYLALEPTIAAHKVQRNADPYHYAPYWADAVLLVSTLTADPSLQSVDSRGSAAQLPRPVPRRRALGWCLRRRHRVHWAAPDQSPSRGASHRLGAPASGQWLGWLVPALPGVRSAGLRLVVLRHAVRHRPVHLCHARRVCATTVTETQPLVRCCSGQPAAAPVTSRSTSAAGRSPPTTSSPTVQISVVPATDIETKWGATYLGWSPPYFPGGG